MRKRIPIEALRVGMYVEGMDEPWLRTPFLRHRFAVRKERQIEKIKECGITHVYIDTERGADLEPWQEGMPAGLDAKLLVEGGGEQTRPGSAGGMTASEMREFSRRKESFLQIERSTLMAGSFIDFSLFVKRGLAIEPLLECRGREVEIGDMALPEEAEVLIRSEDMTRYKVYLNDLVRSRIADIPLQDLKNKVIKESTKVHVKELLNDPRSGTKLKECRGAVEELIGALHESGGFVTSLLTLNKHDYYTYTHSVEVSVLAVGTAMALGMDREGDLFALGIGSLLHDLGKSQIPVEILNKPVRLTPEEFAVMKRHVLMGKKLLESSAEMPASAIHPIVEHHEKLSGEGYPAGLRGADIHLSGKIAAIADVYDAITTSRPYQRAMQPVEALMIIRGQDAYYDREIFEVFVKMLGNQIGGAAKRQIRGAGGTAHRA
ncbi:MAG: HD-GYP domain-containing protein [Thermodesulfovibrionales bacterium]